jgi:hypothetical protein
MTVVGSKFASRMNYKEPMDEYTIIKGRKYRYDTDFDAYYPVSEPSTRLEQWSWVIVTLILAASCFYIEFYR